jgi:hypothetical protein
MSVIQAISFKVSMLIIFSWIILWASLPLLDAFHSAMRHTREPSGILDPVCVAITHPAWMAHSISSFAASRLAMRA